MGDAWTDYAGVYEAYASNFRYAKYRLDFATANHGIMDIISCAVKLEMKQKTFEGTATCLSTDSGGTPVDITGKFSDVSSIQVTPLSTSSVVAVYDFLDAPNPTTFKILLFNSSGARVGGTASYILRGV